MSILFNLSFIHEKSVGVLQPLVPQLEPFALPIVVRTSNAEAHADMYITPSAYLTYVRYTSGLVITHP